MEVRKMIAGAAGVRDRDLVPARSLAVGRACLDILVVSVDLRGRVSDMELVELVVGMIDAVVLVASRTSRLLNCSC